MPLKYWSRVKLQYVISNIVITTVIQSLNSVLMVLKAVQKLIIFMAKKG